MNGRPPPLLSPTEQGAGFLFGTQIEGATPLARRTKHYGFGSLLLDVVLTLLTGGLWLIVICIKFLRSNSR